MFSHDNYSLKFTGSSLAIACKSIIIAILYTHAFALCVLTWADIWPVQEEEPGKARLPLRSGLDPGRPVLRLPLCGAILDLSRGWFRRQPGAAQACVRAMLARLHL